MRSLLRNAFLMLLLAIGACSPGSVSLPSPEWVCLKLAYSRAERLPAQPEHLRLSPGTRNGYVDWLEPGLTIRSSGEWAHDGGSWLWITLPLDGVVLRYVLVTSGPTVRGQVTSDASAPGSLPGLAQVTGRLNGCTGQPKPSEIK